MSHSWLRAAGLAVMLGGIAALGLHWALAAAEDKPGDTLPADLARVPARSLAMISVRAADVWSSPLARGMRDKLGKEIMAQTEAFEKKTGLTPADIERATLVIRESPDAPPLLFFSTTKAFDKAKVFSVAVPGGKEEKYGGETITANETQAGLVLGDKAFVVGTKGDIQSLIDSSKDKITGGLTLGLALAAKKHSIVAAVNPAVLSPDEDKLPPELAPFKPLFKVSSATLALDLGETTTGNIRLVFAGPDEAANGVKAVEAGRDMALGFLGKGIKELSKDESSKPFIDVLEIARKSLKSAAIKRDGNVVHSRLELKYDQATLGAVATAAMKRTREAASRIQSTNNLKQIALAMHNYLSTNNTFPAQAIYDKDGKALLSWRVMLLPYIEANDLYAKFKLDEAWDGPNNKKLLEKIPIIYQLPNGKPSKPYGTFYHGFAGKSAFFEGKKGIGIADITDGTSNTLMVVEAAKDVPWTKPEDLAFDPDKPLPKLGGHYATPGFNAAICDGSVRFFSKIKEETLKKYITRNGGEVIGPDE